jgi:serine/threonine-protein kinase
VLYQLLTDKRPFDGDNDFSIIHQIIGHNPPAPSTINDKLPNAIDAVVARALAKSRDDRFATARDFASALQSAIRRAEDQTIVPPANPQKKPDTSNTGSRGGQSIAGAVTSPSTVTQEVELVYWKDIKDSTEPEEFEAFLDKFPAGIYADLARKRLRKLQGGGSSPDQTILSGMTSVGRATPEVDDEATRLRTGTMPSVVSTPLPEQQPAAAAFETAPPPAAPESQPPSEPVSDFPSTITLARPDAPAATPAPVPSPAPKAEDKPKPQAPAKAPKPAKAAAAAAKKPPVAVIAGVGAVLVLGFAAFAFMGRGSKAPDANLAALPAASSASAAASEASAPAAMTVAAPASATAAVVAASEAKPAASVAAHHPSKPAVARAAPKPKVAPSATPVETPRPAPVPAAPPPVASRPVTAPASSAAAMAAVDACKERVFLSKEFCLSENCEKPGARNHPLCVEWRNQKRLRENSRIGN